MVTLYRYDDSSKKWVRVAVELTGPQGGVRFVREPSTSATFALAFSGGPVFTAARSAQTTVTVTG
jgi:hypothetical protein